MCEISVHHLCYYLIVAVTFAVVKGDNFTEKYMTMETNRFHSRQQRFLSFNTDPDGEVSIEMQFSVPFIRIPVKKAMEAGKGAIANLNVAAIVVSGAIIVVSGFIIPAILKLVDKKIMPVPVNPGFNRGGKTDTSEWWRILALMDQALIENNVDTTSCMQRAVCWAVKSSISKVSTGQASSRDKIIDGIVANEWINQLVDGTPIQSAIKNGLNGINCSNEYSTCKVNQKSLSMFLKQFTTAINLT